MSTPDPDPLYELYALGQATAAEREEIAARLAAGDAAALRSLKEAIEDNARLAALPVTLEPPPRLRRRILAAAGIEEKTGWSWFGAWGLTTAALLGGMVYYSVEARRLERDLVDARAELAAREPRAGMASAGPEARVVRPSEGDLRLSAARLPTLGAGRVFGVWLLSEGRAPQAAGRFRADAAGAAVVPLPGATDPAVTAIAISIDPEAGAAAPVEPPLLIVRTGR